MTDHRLTRRGLLAGLGGLAMTGVAWAQTPVASPTPVRRIPSLRIGVSSLESAQGMDAMWLASLVYDAPLTWNAANRILPAIYSPTTFQGGSNIGLRLRTGVMASDGTLTSLHHLEAAIEQLADSESGWRLAWLNDIEINGDTLWLDLSRPDASITATLAHPSMHVLVNQHGTGPFVPQEETASGALYRRNHLFWQVSRPHIDRLDVIEISDDTQRSIAMATGELDILPNVPLLDVPMLANEPTVYLVGGPSNRLCHLQVRTDVMPLRDKRVRQILAAAIDRAALVKIATADQSQPASTLLPPDDWIQDVETPDHLSPETVRAELRDLGLPADIRLHLLADNADSTLANTAVVLQDQLANCGISLSITLLDGEELDAAVRGDEYDLLVSYSEPWRDPHELVWPLLASDGVNNWSRYDSVEIDTVLRAAIALSDREFRIGRYSRLERIILRDAPVIPLFRPHVWDAVSTRYPGYTALPPTTCRGLMTVLPTST
ncbi:MAG: ABC transporter substrate-binding protein [Thermomicrobiales bacterium]|nr:ABC transporter substrate-binding protein [Thermomicrobiales bacterium]